MILNVKYARIFQIDDLNEYHELQFHDSSPIFHEFVMSMTLDGCKSNIYLE